MTIPDKPLEFLTEPGQLTQREMRLLSPKGFDLYDLHDFLAKHTSYTLDEILDITNDEMVEVAKQLGEAIQKRAVPLSN